MIRTVAALLLAAAPISRQLAPSYGPFPGFGRGVHVFDRYVVDLGWSVEFDDLSLSGLPVTSAEAAGWSNTHVEICTTSELYCLRSLGPGGLISLAVPRRCPANLKEGAAWHVGDVRTVVLKRWAASWVDRGGPPPPDSGPGIVYLLGDPAKPHVVYRYVLGWGVTDLLLAKSSADDLVQAAKDGRLSSGSADIARDARLSTPDTFTACSFERHSSLGAG